MSEDPEVDGYGLGRRELLRRGALVGSTLGTGVGATGLGAADALQVDDGTLFAFPDCEDLSPGEVPTGWSVVEEHSQSTVGATDDAVRGERSFRLDDYGGGWAWAETSVEGGVAFTCQLQPNGLRSTHHQFHVYTEEWGVGLGSDSSSGALDLVYDGSDPASALNFQGGATPEATVSNAVEWGETVTVSVVDVADGLEVRIDGEPVLETGDAHPVEGTLQVRADDLDARVDAPGGLGTGSIVVEQPGTDPIPIEPVTSDGRDVADFYSYGNPDGSSANTGLEEVGASQLFFYEDPDSGELSLVAIHDAASAGNGGSATFDVSPGLPEAGSWTVRDDPSHAPDNFGAERTTWRWGTCCTDGGAYSGGFDGAFEFEVDASFSGIGTWQLLTAGGDGGLADVAAELDPSQPVTIRRGAAASGKRRPSDADLASRAGHGSGLALEYGERGAKSMSVGGTETLFHEFFALETSTGEVVPSYDEDAVTVVSEFEPVNQPPLPGQVATLEVEIGGTTVEVEREVTVELDEPRVSVDYGIEMADSRSALDLTLYTAADLDVAGPDGDVATYHEDGEFAYVEDAGDDVPHVVGIAADDDPDDHDLREYPAYEAVENGDLAGSDAFPDSGEGDAVAVLGFDLGTLRSGDLGQGPGSTYKSRQVRLGAAESVEDLWDVLDRRVDLSFVEPRLAQAVEDTRLVDQAPPGESTLRRIDDPPMVDDKRTVPLFELELDNRNTTTLNDQQLVVTTLAEAGSHPGRTMVDRLEVSVDDDDLEDLAGSSEPLTELEDVVPGFELSDGVTAVRLSLARSDDLVAGDRVTLERDADFESESMDPLRVGFVPVEGPEDGTLVDDWGDFFDDYVDLVDDAVELIEQMFPVPEVRAYAHTLILEGEEDDDGDCAVLGDGLHAQEVLEDQAPLDAGDTVRGTGPIDAFDVTLAVVPDEYFEFHMGSWSGFHMGDPEAAALAEVSASDETVAHELGHHFSGDLYEEDSTDHELAQRDDEQTETEVDGLGVDFGHARYPDSDEIPNTVDPPGMLCRKVQVTDDLADLDYDAKPLMSYADYDEWIDGFQYNDMIEQGLEGHPRSGGAVDWANNTGQLWWCRAPDPGGSGVAPDSVSVGSGDEPVTGDEEGEVTLEVLDVDGEVVSTHRTEPYTRFDAQDPSESGRMTAFTARVPLAEDAVHVRTTYEGTSETTNVLAESVRSAIRELPAEALVGPEARRDALVNKLDAVAAKIDDGAYRGAARQLRNDVRPRVEQWVGEDWSGTAMAPSRAELLERIDARAADLEALAESTSGASGGGQTGSDGEDAPDGE